LLVKDNIVVDNVCLNCIVADKYCV